jgi:protocatechuate 3,4-dioxygenase beta subunit
MDGKDGASRRQFLRTAALTGGGLFALQSAVAEMCGLTPPQTEGPFYPVSKITDDSINDLSVIDGHSHHAKGEVVYISGVVEDEDCNPVEGALVEIWQAAASGRYDHPADDSGLEKDGDFQGWGEFITGADGRYAFKTIVPGHYPADLSTGWYRPPHIHFKITRRGFHESISQMYFTPSSFTGEKARLIEKLNHDDLILKRVDHPERVVIPFAPAKADTEVGPLLAYRMKGGKVTLTKVGLIVAATGEKIGSFDLVLRQAR